MLRGSWLCLVLSTLFIWAQGRTTMHTYTPYQSLPTEPLPAVNDSGEFLWPVTTSSQIFSAGSVMNISWITTLSQINLWLIPDFDWDEPCSLISNSADSYFLWSITCSDSCVRNCSVPWLVRVTNAQGTGQDQRDGGFVSAQFWIEDPESKSMTTSSSSSSSSSSRSSTTSTTSTTSTISTTSSTISLAAVETTSSSITSTATPSSYLSPTTPAEQSGYSTPSSGTQDQSKAVGTAVGLGLGLALVALTGGFCYLWQRSRRRRLALLAASEAHQKQQQHSMHYGRPYMAQPPHKLSLTHYSLRELPAQRTSEMYHEAPGRNQEPQELPGKTTPQVGKAAAWS